MAKATGASDGAIYTELTRYASVRGAFSELGTWAPVLQDWRRGVNVPLRVAVIEGPLDAPEWMPAGSMQSRTRGPVRSIVARSSDY